MFLVNIDNMGGAEFGILQLCSYNYHKGNEWVWQLRSCKELILYDNGCKQIIKKLLCLWLVVEH